MNSTTIQIRCLGGVSSETLQTVAKVLFPATEALESKLATENALRALDHIDWNVEVEGPAWDYSAQGEAVWNRGMNRVGFCKVRFRSDKMILGERHQLGDRLDGVEGGNEIASRLLSQEVGLEQPA